MTIMKSFKGKDMHTSIKIGDDNLARAKRPAFFS